MKKIFPILLTFTLFFSISKTIFAQENYNTKAILDSLEVLKKVGGYVDGFNNPPTAEEIRFYNITQMIYGLPFQELKKLMKDKNPISRTYGFSVFTNNYFDSLNKEDLNILEDTSTLPIYVRGKIITGYFTVGKYCTMAHNSTISTRKDLGKEQEIINAVQSFIKNNAQFSNSYEPGDFNNYSWSSSENRTMYEIQHHYKLKNKDGKLVEMSNYFIFNQNFEINIIEKERSKIISVLSPEIDEWMKEFGK